MFALFLVENQKLKPVCGGNTSKRSRWYQAESGVRGNESQWTVNTGCTGGTKEINLYGHSPSKATLSKVDAEGRKCLFNDALNTF